ncbi:hypothetical protein PVAP13_8NG313968 [Panicum virgatum]|uniref:CCHC-type domain-containing protein n=1 Tax=Panicum virgatum TaxID=38727 RepID=A0A8T0PG64_PANVG|nr:hypothetical protein PVAP13_8NG313968 [Panicum virgatum]
MHVVAVAVAGRRFQFSDQQTKQLQFEAVVLTPLRKNCTLTNLLSNQATNQQLKHRKLASCRSLRSLSLPPPATAPAPAATSPPSAGDHSDLRRRRLNPDAAPFSPAPVAGPSHSAEGCSPEGICFSLPSDSEDDEDAEELNWIPPCSSPKGKGPALEGRRRSASPARGSGGFMADARRSFRDGGSIARSRSSPVVDEEGFCVVVNKRRRRRSEGAPRRHGVRRPVPADLVGRCFNCLAFDHVAARCSRPSRCLRCEETGHVAKNCKRPRHFGPPLRGRGRPVRRAGLFADAAVAANSRAVGRSAASASTASDDSASTGRAYSGPPSICAASPEAPGSPPARLGGPPVIEPELPRGHPSRRPQVAHVTVPRSAELQAEEDSLAASALTVLVLGTHPTFAPYQVRRFIQDNYAIPAKDFTLHQHWPEDFLVVFQNAAVAQRVLDAPPLACPDMVLRFRRWSRLSMGEGETMRYRVLLEIRGFPAHAWSAATAQVVLGEACAVPEPTPSTVARADTRRFHTAVWCMDPDRIPNEAFIRIPERVPGLGNNPLFLRPDEVIHHHLPLLRYKVEIEILEIQDWNDSDSSDDSDLPPDRVLSNSDDDDYYSGFDQHSRGRSGPWPRRTVFRTPGYGDVGGSSGPSGSRNSGALLDMPHCPIRFGSFPWPSENHCTSLSACHSIVDRSFPIKNLEVNQEVTTRDFDPMLLEAQAYGVSREPCSAARDFDPMLLESVTGGPPPGRHKSPVPPGTEALLNSSSVLLGATSTSLAEPEATFLPAVAVANDASSGRLSSDNAVLETVRFDVPEGGSAACDSLCNITVARGTRATLPLHLFSDISSLGREVVANFAAAVCRDAPAPALLNSPPRRRSKQPDQAFSIRRSKRLAMKSRHRATKPAIQAQNVMMKKMGITSESQPPDATSFQQFTDTFSSTLTISHCEALDALLPKGMGSLAVEPVAPMVVS